MNQSTYIPNALRFELGSIFITRGVKALLDAHLGASLMPYLLRHAAGDWGRVSTEDKRLNDVATREGFRVLSSYAFCGETLWIITEADRRSTTVLFPHEY